MTAETAIDPQLIQAYKETHYHVGGDPPFVLHIGQNSQELAALHTRLDVFCSAYITASNPFSQNVGSPTNEQLRAKLERDLTEHGLRYIEGIGQHPSGEWPGEASFLVLGLRPDAAKTLGRKYGQNAIVCCGPDAMPQLVLLR